MMQRFELKHGVCVCVFALLRDVVFRRPAGCRCAPIRFNDCDDDESFLKFAREFCLPYFHPVGTCRMGREAQDSVVSADDLRSVSSLCCVLVPLGCTFFFSASCCGFGLCPFSRNCATDLWSRGFGDLQKRTTTDTPKPTARGSLFRGVDRHAACLLRPPIHLVSTRAQA